jgi:mannosyltransferase
MIFFKKYEQTIIVIFLVLINFIIKGVYLSSNSLAGDEPFSVYYAQMNIGSIINILSEGNNPPLYEIILHFWIQIFGISEFSVRMPSLIFSCLTVFFIYKIGVKFINSRVAFYASVIFIFSNYQIYFAHEARVYALLGLLTAISMYVFLGIIYDDNINSKSVNNHKSNDKAITKFIILAGVNTLIIYSHYFGFFVLMVQVLFFMFHLQFLFKNWKKIILYLGIIILLYSPNILVLFNRFHESSGDTWVQPPRGLESVYNMLWNFSNTPVVTVCIITLLIISIVKHIVNYKKEVKKIYTGFIIFWFGFIFIFMFGISYWIPMFMDRYLMPASIAFPLLVGIGADYSIQKSKYKFIIPIAVILLYVVTVRPNNSNKREVKEMILKIKELKTSNTIVYFCPDWFKMNFVYYYNVNYFKAHDDDSMGNRINQYLQLENIYPISNYNQIDTKLIKSADKFIYLDAAADFHSPNNNIRKKLELSYKLKSEYKFHEIFNVYEYELK